MPELEVPSTSSAPAAGGAGPTAGLNPILPRATGKNPDNWELPLALLHEISDEAADKCGYDDAVLEQVEAIALATERRCAARVTVLEAALRAVRGYHQRADLALRVGAQTSDALARRKEHRAEMDAIDAALDGGSRG